MCTRFLFLVAVILLLSSAGFAGVGSADDYALIASSLAVTSGRTGYAMGQSMAAVGHSRQGYSYASVSAESTAAVGNGQMAYSHSSAVAVGRQACGVGPQRCIGWQRCIFLRLHFMRRLCQPPCPPVPLLCLP